MVPKDEAGQEGTVTRLMTLKNRLVWKIAVSVGELQRTRTTGGSRSVCLLHKKRKILILIISALDVTGQSRTCQVLFSLYYTNIDWCRGQHWKIMPGSCV